MKKGIHPQSQNVVFKDVGSSEMYVISTTMKTSKTVSFNGSEMPLIEVETSSSSHPFYTGDTKVLDTAGRAEKFRNRAVKASK